MSRTNGQPVNGSRSSNGRPLNAKNLAEVPPVNENEIGLRKYILTPPHEEPYYLPVRISDRETHERRLDEQTANLEELITQGS
ncbi:uncharacterized protein BHQ10_007366 [Talaromyces amestolkiae]|uniref:Uncharacterized protein n=1 Tax=Talaromyces amestolkiae TaxID=1196081 RepID=A0A364L6C5_TALAM|nr:uncharacterized protein BHQ10_007366 [Talaromyces amestolkiae]RAO71354.1 hypothetical protein BHQ10_007366 [Talaromyces amestolkiae]